MHHLDKAEGNDNADIIQCTIVEFREETVKRKVFALGGLKIT